MSIRIDMHICRVCLRPDQGTSILTGDVADKFKFTTLLQVLLCCSCIRCVVDLLDWASSVESIERARPHMKIDFRSIFARRQRKMTGYQGSFAPSAWHAWTSRMISSGKRPRPTRRFVHLWMMWMSVSSRSQVMLTEVYWIKCACKSAICNNGLSLCALSPPSGHRQVC